MEYLETLNLDNLRWYLWQKQGLLAGHLAGYTDVMKRCIALHSTDYLTPYLSLWARLVDFDPQVLFDDLNVYNRVARLRAFRGTVFVVHKDLQPLVQKSAPVYLRTRIQEIAHTGEKLHINIDDLKDQILSSMNGEALTARQINKSLKTELSSDAMTVVLRLLEFQGLLARGSQRNILDRVVRYKSMLHRIKAAESDPLKPEKAFRELLKQYIIIFGPVSLEDICWWFPVNRTVARKQLEALSSNWIQVDRNGQICFMEKEDWLSFQQFEIPRKKPQCVFLPYEDHFPKGYFHRDWFMAPQAKSMLFSNKRIDLGQIRPSIWLDGEIVGRWEWEWNDQKTEIRVQNIDILPTVSKTKKSLIENKKKSLERFLNDKIVPMIYS